MRKDCNGDDSASSWRTARLGEAAGLGNSSAVFTRKFLLDTRRCRRELYLLRPFREISLFRSLPDVCGGKSPRHSAKCVESYFTNRYANIVSVWFATQAFHTSGRRNIYLAPFLLRRFSDALIFPSSLYLRHFHFLFPSLFHSVFFFFPERR